MGCSGYGRIIQGGCGSKRGFEPAVLFRGFAVRDRKNLIADANM